MQQSNRRIWDLTSLPLSPSTSIPCWQSLNQLPVLHISVLNPILQCLLPARQTHLWAAAQALLPMGWDFRLWCLQIASCESPAPHKQHKMPWNAPQCYSGDHCQEVLLPVTTAVFNLQALCSSISPYFPRLLQIPALQPVKGAGMWLTVPHLAQLRGSPGVPCSEMTERGTCTVWRLWPISGLHHPQGSCAPEAAVALCRKPRVASSEVTSAQKWAQKAGDESHRVPLAPGYMPAACDSSFGSAGKSARGFW